MELRPLPPKLNSLWRELEYHFDFQWDFDVLQDFVRSDFLRSFRLIMSTSS